jgi:predicted dehydrogenase
LDQGSHLLDLAQWFLGNFSQAAGLLPNYFWKSLSQNTEGPDNPDNLDDQVEDNAFMLLTTAQGQCAFLHATWTEWKNNFSFEITGRDGKLALDGLGGSYGLEQLAVYKMLPTMGPPETVIYQYPFPDTSWERELAEISAAISQKRPVMSSVEEAIAILELIDKLYSQQNFRGVQ